MTNEEHEAFRTSRERIAHCAFHYYLKTSWVKILGNNREGDVSIGRETFGSDWGKFNAVLSGDVYWIDYTMAVFAS